MPLDVCSGGCPCRGVRTTEAGFDSRPTLPLDNSMTNDLPLDALIKRTLREARKRFGKPLGVGRHRACFAMNDRFVLKVPRTEEGLNDNESEANGTTNHPHARCRKLYSKDGVPLLVMERVTYPEHGSYDKLPDWAKWVDCMQVGYTAKGVLVAYDFA